jgi:zinc protease
MPADANSPLRVERTVLDNGLTVVRQAPPPAARSFSATFVSPAGWAYDPDDRRGVSTFMTSLLTSGAGRFDRVTLARLLDGYGATLGAGASPESAEVTIWGPANVQEPLLDLLAEVVLRPRFDLPDVERVRRQIHERQLREVRQPDGRAERDLLRSIFPEGHPYRRTGLGDAGSVRKINRADLRKFHATHFTAGGSFLVVTGPPRLDALVRNVKGRFREFSADTAPDLPAVPAVSANPGDQRVPMPGRAQVEIRIGGGAVARTDPLYPALFLANEVLGGRSILSRLFQRVRESAGLAYHASSEVEAMRWGGFWQVQAGTGPERVDKAVRLIERELERVCREPIPGPELERIRESTIGELPLALETTSGAHELAVDIAYHGLPDDHLITWPATLRALTAEEICAAAATVLDPHRCVRVLAGPIQSTRPRRARRSPPGRVRTHTYI